MSNDLDIVDIHTHLWPVDWGQNGSRRISGGLPDDVLRKIVDPASLIDEFSIAGVSLAVLSTTIESLFGMLTSSNVRSLLEQALLVQPVFQVRWRWNVTRALAVLRFRGGKKVPPHMQRFRAEDLLTSVFPM